METTDSDFLHYKMRQFLIWGLILHTPQCVLLQWDSACESSYAYVDFQAETQSHIACMVLRKLIHFKTLQAYAFMAPELQKRDGTAAR